MRCRDRALWGQSRVLQRESAGKWVLTDNVMFYSDVQGTENLIYQRAHLTQGQERS